MIAAVLVASALAAPVITDGDRYVAFPQAGGVRVLDETTGRARTYPRPERCVEAAVGGDRLVWSCKESNRDLVVTDLATGLDRDIGPGYPYPDPYSSTAVVGVGRNWIAAEFSAYHVMSVPIYYDVESGESRGEAEGRRQYEDLDAPELARPLCAPLRRHRWPRSFPTASPRFWRTRVLNDMVIGIGLNRGRIQRCGRTGSLGFSSLGARIGGTRVLWRRGNVTDVYDTERHRRSCARTPGAVAVAHTARHLYVTRVVRRRLRVKRRPLPQRRCTGLE